MRLFRVESVAQTEFDEAADWYESQREGLGFDFVAEVERVLLHIEQAAAFPTAPISKGDRFVVRREFVERFPYVVVFVEMDDERRVIMIRRGTSNPQRWSSRV